MKMKVRIYALLLLAGAAACWIVFTLANHAADASNASAVVQPGLVLEAWEGAGEPAYLYKPTSVAIDDDANILVLDAGNQRIVVFDQEGKFQHAFGGPGQGPGEFNFGTDPEDDLAVDDDFIVVLEKQRRILHVFDRKGGFVDRFAIANDAHSMALRKGRILVSLLPTELGKPTVAEYSIHGERLEEFGSGEFDGKLRQLGKGFIASDEAGNIRRAQLFYPMVRRFAEDGSAVDEWHDFSQWSDEKARVRVLDGQTEDDRRRLRENPGGADIIGRHSVFWDLEYAADTDEWVGLIYGPIIQIFSANGRPKRHFVPSDGLSEEERDGWPWDIGVDSSAHRVCVAFYRESKVRCYAIPAA